MANQTVEVLVNPEIVHQTFLAEANEGYLPVGQSILLECLHDTDDGIFETEKSWFAFLRGNFGDGQGSIYLNGTPKDSTLKKWCMGAEQYNHKFVVYIGNGKYVQVNPDNLTLTFSYDANNYASDPDRHHKNGMPNGVEFYVTATLVGEQ